MLIWAKQHSSSSKTPSGCFAIKVKQMVTQRASHDKTLWKITNFCLNMKPITIVLLTGHPHYRLRLSPWLRAWSVASLIHVGMHTFFVFVKWVQGTHICNRIFCNRVPEAECSKHGTGSKYTAVSTLWFQWYYQTTKRGMPTQPNSIDLISKPQACWQCQCCLDIQTTHHTWDTQ